MVDVINHSAEWSTKSTILQNGWNISITRVENATILQNGWFKSTILQNGKIFENISIPRVENATILQNGRPFCRMVDHSAEWLHSPPWVSRYFQKFYHSAEWSIWINHSAEWLRSPPWLSRYFNHSAEWSIWSTILQNGWSRRPFCRMVDHSAEWLILHFGSNIYMRIQKQNLRQ